MICRNKKHIQDYRYLVMFDLASKLSGVCVWNVMDKKPEIVTHLTVNIISSELPAYELNNQINSLFQSLYKKGILSSEILVYKEAMPSQVHGGSSTVQTFIALARSHAVLDLYCASHGLDVYDYVGVYPITTHSYLKKLRGWDKTHPITKDDIKDYVESEYGLQDLTYDEADAVFLAKTFLEVKWNNDLNEEIRAVKRHQKTLKAQHAINACEAEQTRLNGLKTTLNEE